MDIIEYLAAYNNEPTRLQDIAAGLGMNVSTVLRFLTALCEIGACCIAVPVRDYTQKIIACVSVTGTIFRMTDEKLNQNMNYLLEQSRKLSNMLGYYENGIAYDQLHHGF